MPFRYFFPALIVAVLSAVAPAKLALAQQSDKPDQKAAVIANSCKKPDYPSLSLRYNEHGTTRAQLTVGADGKLLFVAVAKSSGFERLDLATITALNDCRYNPAIKDGQPVVSTYLLDYLWTIPDAPKVEATVPSLTGVTTQTGKSTLSQQLTEQLAGDPDLRTGQLPNGLTYYIRKNVKPAQHVELRLVVKAGSILEDEDQRGLAHFAEHLAFDGTRHFAPHTLISTMESLGVKFGADLNAFTSFNDTIYILPLPLDKPDNLETGFKILEDWAQGALMTNKAIEQERPIVLEEAHMEKGAAERMNQKIYPDLYNGSRYAQRIPIGLDSVLTTFKPDAVRRFYHDWYRPDLEAVIVVGDIDPDAVEQMVEAHFSALTNPHNERARDYAAIAARTQSAGIVLTDKESTYNTLTIRYPIETAFPEKTIADYQKILARRLCLDMMEQRLLELTQQADPPFIGATYAVDPTAVGYETVLASAIVGRGGIVPALNAIEIMTHELRTDGFTADELERSKKNMKHRFDNLYAERFGTHSATLADVYRRNFLFRESMMGLDYHQALASELIPAVTLAEVNTMMRSMAPPDAARLITYTGTTGENEPLPDGPGLLAMLDNADRVAAKTHEANAVSRHLPDALMAQAPHGGSIVSKRKHKDLGLTEFTLSNGVKVLLKPTYLQRQQVLLSAERFGGQSLFSDADKFNARYAGTMQAVMGYGDFTPLEIAKIVTGKSIHFQTDMTMYTDTINGSADADDVETLFQWLYLAMTAPRRDEKLFNAYLGRLQDLARNTMLRPESIFQDQVLAKMFSNHPRTPYQTHAEDIDHVSIDRVMEIYRQRFGSAEGLTFVITGSIDVDKITPLITTYLGALPTGKIDQHFRDVGLKPADGKLTVDVKAGSEDKSQVLLNFNGTTDYSVKEANHFYAAIDVMKQRITHVLREQLSLTYNGSISGAMHRTPVDSYNISAELPCLPANTGKVIAALYREIDSLKKDGPKPEELERVKQLLIKERQTEKMTNQFWLTHLQDSVLFDSDPALILTYENRINAITAEQVRDAARRYFDLNNVMEAVLSPVDKKSTEAAPAPKLKAH